MADDQKAVWILNHFAKAPDMAGGTRHYSLARDLVERGYDVTIFATPFTHTLYRDRDIHLIEGERWKVQIVDGVRFVWLRTFPYQGNTWRRVVNMFSYMWASYRTGRACQRLIPEIPTPEVIIGSSVHLLAVLSAYYLAKYFHSHFIMEVRDVWPQALIDVGKLPERSVVTWAMRKLEHFLYKRAERIIVLLPGAVDYIANLDIPRERIVYVPNGVDLALFSQSLPRGDHSGFRIMYLGSHGVVNGLDTLLDAIKLIQDQGYSDIYFELVGDGGSKPQLIASSRELGLHNIQFFNPIPKTQVHQALNRADVLVSIHANALRFGVSANKLFDYMASAKPIIFSGDAPNDIVRDARCGLSVPRGDSRELAHAIIRLAQISREERQCMGQRGRVYVEQYHDYAILADHFQQCIEDLG